MDSIIQLVFLALLNVGPVVADLCSSFSHGGIYFYCSHTCKGNYGYQYCDDDDDDLSGGAIAGIVLGTLVFVAIVISIIVACCYYKKLTGTGTRGHVIHPTYTRGRVTFVQPHEPQFYPAQQEIPYVYSTYGSAYPYGPVIAAPRPPAYPSDDVLYQPPEVPTTSNNQQHSDQHVALPPLSTVQDPNRKR